MHNKQLKTLLVLPKWKKTHQTRFYAGNSDNKRQRAPSAGSPRTHELRASWSCQFVGCLKKRCKNCTYWCLHLLRQDRAVRKVMLSLYSPVPFKGFRQGNAGWGEVASLSRSTHCELNLLGRVCAQKVSTRSLKGTWYGSQPVRIAHPSKAWMLHSTPGPQVPGLPNHSMSSWPAVLKPCPVTPALLSLPMLVLVVHVSDAWIWNSSCLRPSWGLRWS